jgi:hypothetical protein
MKLLLVYNARKLVAAAAGSTAWILGRSLAGTAASNPAGVLFSVSFERYVLPGRGLCVGLIPRPEVYYRECVSWSVISFYSTIQRYLKVR